MQYQSFSPSSACQFDVTGEHFVCKNCGLRVPTRLFPKGKPFVACTNVSREATPSAVSTSPPPAPPRAVRGLGDLLADGLSAIGITKDRVNAAAMVAGVKDCGCGRRQKWMNKMGEKYLGVGKTPENNLDSQ